MPEPRGLGQGLESSWGLSGGSRTIDLMRFLWETPQEAEMQGRREKSLGFSLLALSAVPPVGQTDPEAKGKARLAKESGKCSSRDMGPEQEEREDRICDQQVVSGPSSEGPKAVTAATG